MSVKNKWVFVTGASGTIGKVLVDRLLKDGYQVVVLTRDRTKVKFDGSVKVIEADLLDIDKYQDVMCQCQYVFHLAVYQNMFDKKIDEFERVNVLGVRQIIRALKKTDVAKFFYVSTTMVLEPTDKNNLYVRTKAAGLKLVKSSSLPWIILYPSIVVDLSKSDGSWWWKLLTGGIPGGLRLRLCPANRVFNFVWIDDLVERIVCLIKTGKIKSDYILKGDDLTADSYLRKVHKMLGKKYIPWRMPIL